MGFKSRVSWIQRYLVALSLILLPEASDAGLGYGATPYGSGWFGYGPAHIVRANVAADPTVAGSANVGMAIPEGTTLQVALRLSTKPPTNQTITVSKYSGDNEVSIGTTQFVFTPNNWNQDQFVSLMIASDPDSLNGSAIIRYSSPEMATADLIVTESDRTGPDDWDHDGHSNEMEYIAGTDWLNSQSRLQPSISRQGNNFILRFETLATTPEYGGRIRHYALESTADIKSGAWNVVAGAGDIVSVGTYQYTTQSFDSKRFYRTKVWLAP